MDNDGPFIKPTPAAELGILRAACAHLRAVRAHLHLMDRGISLVGSVAMGVCVWLASKPAGWILDRAPDAALWVLIPVFGTFFIMVGGTSLALALMVVTGPLAESEPDAALTSRELAGVGTFSALTGIGTLATIASAGNTLAEGATDNRTGVDPANTLVGAGMIALGGLLWHLLVDRFESGDGTYNGIAIMLLMSPLLAWSSVKLLRQWLRARWS